jgi:hypothetical protein
MGPKKKASDDPATPSTTTKKAKLPSLVQHIELLLDETPKLSLQALKSQLGDARDIDFSNGAPNTQLKKALVKGVEENKFSKLGGSYVKLGYTEPQVAEEPSSSQRLAPQWRGLKVLKKEAAKSERSKCQQCGQLFAAGAQRLQVMDDSLFKACIQPGDCHEGVSRGYVEGIGPQGETVARRKFFVHPSCLAAANDSCEAAFYANLPLLDIDHNDRSDDEYHP